MIFIFLLLLASTSHTYVFHYYSSSLSQPLVVNITVNPGNVSVYNQSNGILIELNYSLTQVISNLSFLKINSTLLFVPISSLKPNTSYFMHISSNSSDTLILFSTKLNSSPIKNIITIDTSNQRSSENYIPYLLLVLISLFVSILLRRIKRH